MPIQDKITLELTDKQIEAIQEALKCAEIKTRFNDTKKVKYYKTVSASLERQVGKARQLIQHTET